MENNELNFNYSECVKSYDKWGSTTYTNICNGKTTTIPWGVGGNLAFIGIVVLILIGISIIGVFVKITFFDF